MKKQVKILIFEDDEDMREGLAWLIINQVKFELSGAYPDANNILNLIRQFEPDVVLMDIQMPGTSGIDALKIIKVIKPNTHVIILTTFEDEDNIFDAISYGASGYLLKINVTTEIVKAIDEVLDGGSPMNARVARKVMRYFSELKDIKTLIPDYNLTTREKEILTHLSEGKSGKMIAKTLFISEQTVGNHIRHIYDKLEVHTRAEAVSKAYREKLL